MNYISKAIILKKGAVTCSTLGYKHEDYFPSKFHSEKLDSFLKQYST